ncbi:aspartate aminotransferase family protein [Lentibacillus sp.]|uniref:aspartate aminotransferase family protein n=1 Tax=Lentibacillus sp. TaxID=1925746 RepID=UPI002B4AB8D6|nr:aspartate aminotransferase family protein [Lentibacillus sp.]HLS07999.1 aspartate aminotransferase family protein [Lentibacillus sp.]
MKSLEIEKNLSLEEKNKKVVWPHISPYREDKAPMVVESGKGSWIEDTHGNRYLDGMSGLWCVNVGYGREELAKAAYDQMLEMAYTPMTQSHVPAIELAEKINELLDDDYMIFYSNSGSDANEVAFKIARQYHQQHDDPNRFKIVSRYRAYHGSSMGALSATGQALRKYKYEPLSTGFLHVAPPDNYRKPEDMTVEQYNIQKARELEEAIIWEQKETVAAVIMEPLISGGGILIPDASYVKEVERICKRHGVLLIIDEVICGFGRTGKAFGHQQFGVRPDMVTMAKGLTSGYSPLSITAVKKDIYEVFKQRGECSHFRHVNTFGGNPAACAVALKNIEIMEKENLFERAEKLGERLLDGLEELKNHPYVGDIRGMGLIIGIEIVEDKTTKEPGSDERVGKFISNCKSRGLIIGRNGETVSGQNNILALCPPLSSTDQDIEFILETVKEVFYENV